MEYLQIIRKDASINSIQVFEDNFTTFVINFTLLIPTDNVLRYTN